MKIESIIVENYKSFKKLELADLKNVNMIFGFNNSGKSNLFTFLDLVFRTEIVQSPVAVVDNRQEYRTERQHFMDKTILNQPFIFRYEKGKEHKISFTINLELESKELEHLTGYSKLFKAFPPTSENFAFEISGIIESTGEYNAQQKVTQIKLQGEEIFNSEKDVVFGGAEGLNFNDFTALIAIFEDCIIFLNNDRYFVDEIENKNPEILPKNFKNGLFNLSLSHLRADDLIELEKFLKNFHLDSRHAVFKNTELSGPFEKFNFKFIRLASNQIEVMLENKFGIFPISNFGTGVQQIIYILSRIFFGRRKKIILIEEIELNLSPKYQLELISFIDNKLIKPKSDFVGQIFFTTHSPLMCYKSEFRMLQTMIDANGLSTMKKVVPSTDDVKKLKTAMKLLEHYKPSNRTKNPKPAGH